MNTITAADSGTWQLGDRTVNRLGFGAMRLPMAGHDGADRDRGTAIAVLRRAVELGVNHIDTAAFYFSARRSANELINTALAPYPDDLVITTKVGPGRDPSGTFLFATPEQLRGQVEENIRQLGRDHLDVVNLRLGDTLDRGAGPLADWFGVLADLRGEGLIRHLGISNIGPEHLTEALAIAPVVCVQNQYGLTSRREDDALVDLCAEHGVAFVPFFAVGGGPVPGRTDDADALGEVAKELDATPSQVRLAWTLHKGPHVLAIPGTGDPAHLEENVAAGALRLTDDQLARLDTIG
ncbi:MAG TPA: oxidoreductase [Actinophytocola sp.]|nr:oxidoreductase [Actinophytocola sp.]